MYVCLHERSKSNDAFRVTDEVVDIYILAPHLEPLHAVKLKVVVDFKECVRVCVLWSIVQLLASYPEVTVTSLEDADHYT